MLRKVEEFKVLLQDKKGWDTTIEEKDPGSELFSQYKTSVAGNPTLRTQAYSDHDPLTTIRAIMDLKVRVAYEDNVTDYEMLGSLGCNLHIAYQKTERVAIISSRDIYNLVFLNALDDGSIILVSTEHPDEEKYPPRDQCVRMKLPVAGVWVKPDPKRPGKSIIH
jgi:hypothetical protein